MEARLPRTPAGETKSKNAQIWKARGLAPGSAEVCRDSAVPGLRTGLCWRSDRRILRASLGLDQGRRRHPKTRRNTINKVEILQVRMQLQTEVPKLSMLQRLGKIYGLLAF